VNRAIARYGRGAIVLLAVLAAIAAWNVLRYPPGLGYDAPDHIAYAEGVLDGRGFPDGVGEYYTPPGFYGVAAGAIWVGQSLGLGQPLRVVQLVNAAFLLGTALLLLELGRLIFPGRRVIHLAALGLFVFGALAPRSAAMVHPETMSMFFSTLALALAARMIVRRAWTVLSATSLGVALGAGQLVRAFSLWTFAVVVLVLVTATIVRGGERRRMVLSLVVTLLATAAVAGPWYAYQSSRYTNPIFDRPQVQVPLWKRRPVSFYVDPRLHEVFSFPTKPHVDNRFVPELYADGWGDYYGVFVWNNSDLGPSQGERRTLVAQMFLAIVPALLLVGGWLALLWRSLTRKRLRVAPERLLAGLLPLAGIVGMLYFTVSYPTPDGDVIKATYMLTTVPAWAICFGYGLDSVLIRRPRLMLVVAVLLGLAALSGLRIALFGSPLGIL
jgi:hypothetical protein